MSTLGPIYEHEAMINYYLFIAIGLCIEIIFILLGFLYVHRFKKIYDKKLKEKYSPVIDSVLFPLLFNNKPIDETIASAEYQTYARREKFQRNLLQSIIKLHTNYSGDYNLKLEEFYRKSGLINLSFVKLESESWSIICEGIRELSQMDIQESYGKICKLVRHRNSTLKLEALLGAISLKGSAGLTVLNDYQQTINDWIQLNLIYEINNNKHSSVYDFSEFLESKNESLVILGLRLISNSNQNQYIDRVKEICDAAKSARVRKQAEQTINKLSYLNFNYLT